MPSQSEVATQREDTFRLYFEESADGLLLMDDKVFVDCNRSALELLGYTHVDQLLGKRPSVISPQFQPDGRRSAEKAQEMVDTVIEQGYLRFEWVHTRQNGEDFFAEILLTLLQNDERPILLSVMRDITERKVAEDALRQMNQTLEEQVALRTTELVRRNEIAEAMRELLAALNSSRSLEEILLFSAEQAIDLLNVDAVVIYQDAKYILYINPIYGWADVVTEIRELPADPAAQYRYILKNGDPIYVLNWENSTLLSRNNNNVTDGNRARLRTFFQGSMSIPLNISTHTNGVLSFYYRDERIFSDDDLLLAQSFAEQVALAIENARLRDKAEQAGAAAERGRLAHDLHDSVTQTLFSASLIAEVLPKLWERNQNIARNQLQELRKLTRGAMAEMRTLLLELRPETLSKAPLSETLRHLVDSTIGRASIPIDLSIEMVSQLSPDIKVAMYRIAQEALNNVAKHSDASQAEIYIRQSEQTLIMEIIDDGIGFQLDDVQPTSLGLNIMRERTDIISAVLTIDSQPGKGTRIHVELNFLEE